MNTRQRKDLANNNFLEWGVPAISGMIGAIENRAWMGIVVGYTKDLEQKMQRLFATLSEKDRRRYAAIEAAKLGHGGTEYVCGLFKLDAKTVRRGLVELELTEDPAASRVRKKGAGASA